MFVAQIHTFICSTNVCRGGRGGKKNNQEGKFILAGAGFVLNVIKDPEEIS